ncbi:Ras superfamily GTP-binding protein YlqF [Scopulibacillus darangshiensis]|uniref:Ribosome biogenesis GTPase A n=1 Tax=Scopulibacillus darangshiensis TaxID=442528 RepID=A0A4R2P4R9_9BACL|nr:ribosome biogenesis GTPase YlqF [Scopulibacillus darangshiensis]TCP29168.1 Ras superfamily GTP-binding protein YlqF [Scopulibacillus darangshiensis]
MTIQWYPGHMAKAKRQMIEKIKLIDVVIELVDSRIPESSRNPLVDEIAADKPRLLILNKADMADPHVTSAWKDTFKQKGYSVHSVNSQTGEGTKAIPDLVHQLTLKKREKLESKGFNARADRALILGIPNVGKSTLINRLANKKIAKIGDRPGVTKAQQWIKVGKTMELLDTPGILWPKFEDPDVGLRLAATGAIKDELVDFQDIAVFLLKTLWMSYPETLSDRYGISDLPPIEAEPAIEEIVELFDVIGKRRGCVAGGGHIDYDRTAEIIVRDYRSQKLGRLTLERP